MPAGNLPQSIVNSLRMSIRNIYSKLCDRVDSFEDYVTETS